MAIVAVRVRVPPLAPTMTYSDPDTRREYQRKRMLRRRADWIKEHGPCARCGSWDDLEVDHIDPKTKAYALSTIWGLALDNPIRLTELAKCQVLCHKCHIKKSIEERGQKPAVHGSLTMHWNGCRCVDCKSAYSLYRKQRRAKGIRN